MLCKLGGLRMKIGDLLSVIKDLDEDMDIWINDDYQFYSIEIDFEYGHVTIKVPELLESEQQ